MTWELLRLPELGLAQWIDRDKAENWRCEIQRILRAYPDPALAPAPNRRLMLAELVGAIGSYARALDLPMPAFEPWDARWTAALQHGRGGLAGLGPETREGTWRGDAVRLLLRQGPDTVQRILRGDWRRSPLSPESSEVYSLSVLPRASLTDAGTLLSTALEAEFPPSAGLRGVDWRGAICPARESAVVGFSSWDCLGALAWWPGAFDGGEPEIRALAPLSWLWDLAVACGTEVATRSVRDVVIRSRAWVAEKNSRTLEWLGVPGTDPSELPRFAAEGAEARERLDPDTERVIRAGQAFAGAVAAANPIVGAVIGALVSLPEIFTLAFGRAISFEVDAWGRRVPLYERAFISGRIGDPTTEAPTHAVAEPPAWGRCDATTDAPPELLPVGSLGSYRGLVREDRGGADLPRGEVTPRSRGREELVRRRGS